MGVLQSVAAGKEERVTEQVLEAIEKGDHATWLDAFAATFEVFVRFFRSEPGFAALRLGDVIDLRPAEGTPRNSVIAETIFDALSARFELEDTPQACAGFEASVETADA